MPAGTAAGHKVKARLKSIVPVAVLAYFTTGAARSIKVKRNIVMSLAIRCCNIAVSFLLVPLTINYVNPTQYGIWITLSSIIAWFSFFDIGFGNGLRNKFAEALALGKHKLARVYVSTTYAVLSMTIGSALVIFFVINHFIDWSKILNTEPEMRNELGRLAFLICFFFALQFVLQTITTIMTAHQEPARAGLVNLFTNVLTISAVYVLVKTTPGSLTLFTIAACVSPVVVLGASTLIMFRGRYRKYMPSWRYIDLRMSGTLIKLGLNFFMIQISALCLFQTDNVIISHLFGPQDVTPYSIAFRYFSIANMIFVIVLTPFWSACTDAYHRKDLAWIRNSSRKLVRIWQLMFVGILLMALLSGPFYELWIGDSVNIPLSLSIACAIYNVIITWSAIFVTFINGVGKLALQSFLAVIMAVVNIPLAIILGRSFGLAGLVYANCICLLVGAIVAYLQYTKIVNGTERGVWAR